MNSAKRSAPHKYSPLRQKVEPSRANQSASAVAQAKTVSQHTQARSPVAPPVYRPQPVPRVLQTKTAGQQQPVGRQGGNPVAPPTYRPQPKKIVQPKMGVPASPKRPVNAGGVIQRVPFRVGKQVLDTDNLRVEELVEFLSRNAPIKLEDDEREIVVKSINDRTIHATSNLPRIAATGTLSTILSKYDVSLEGFARQDSENSKLALKEYVENRGNTGEADAKMVRSLVAVSELHQAKYFNKAFESEQTAVYPPKSLVNAVSLVDHDKKIFWTPTGCMKKSARQSGTIRMLKPISSWNRASAACASAGSTCRAPWINSLRPATWA